MSAKAASKRSGAARTRDTLVTTATRLFAEYGVEGVSLAEINRAAGQRNATALHYHFGGKEGLLQAVFDKHTVRVNALREAMLAVLPESPSIEQVVALLIEPLAEQVRDADGGTDYLQFLGQVNTAPGVNRNSLDRRESPVLKALQHHFAVVLRPLPAPVRALRVEFMVLMIFAALAGYARRIQEGQFDEDHHQLVVDQLTASAAALLAQ